VVQVREGETARAFRPSGLFGWRGTARVEIARADPGDMIAIPGVERVRLGDTLADPSVPEPLPALPAEEPTLAIEVSVNDSPTAGQDGTHASSEQLRERLWRELLTNPSIRIEDTGALGSFRICGRSELQLAILFEVMRREGYELLAGRPSVLTRAADGEILEPVENLVIDCPEVFAQVVGQKVEARGGRVVRMVNHGGGRVRVEYRIPSAGLVGFRSEFLADTRRTGILNHTFDGFAPGPGNPPTRTNGALVAERPGRATARAIEHLQSRGSMFVAPGDAVYEGMIVGENSRANDLAVDVTKEVRTGEAARRGAEPTARLVPPRSLSLEQALEFLHDDEVVEVTPRALRLRKRVLRAPGSTDPDANR
jgi:GTP-binding protein